MLYTVDLKVGSDKKYPYLFKKYSTQLNVNAYSISNATFNMNFNSEDVYKGEFGKWASDKNDTSIWTEAWYSATITPLVGESKVLENYEGRPQLCKPFFEFKNAMVNPTQGSNKDRYSYEVTAFGSYEDKISLQVGPSKDGPWTDLGIREYTTPGLAQTLKWNNVTLDFDFTMAYYRFKGTRQSKAFEGPFWPVIMNTRNSSVSPERGLSSTQFTYSLELISSKKIDVGLNVLDVASKTFKPAGRISYKNASRWERLEWQGIQPSEVSGSEGSSSYYFTFYYPGSEAAFNKTKQQAGPNIALVDFINATVSPENGSVFIPYTYCVDLNTGLPRCDVELQTSDPGSNIWTPQGIASYNGSNRTLIWSGIKLDGGRDGLGRYRFICGDSVSQEFIGPKIGSINIIGKVEPFNGSMYLTKPIEEIEDVYAFTFIGDVRSSQSPAIMVIGLEIYDPSAKIWIPAGTQSYEPGQRWLNYTVNFAELPFQEPFLNETRYRFVSEGRVLNESSGPNILVNLRNESLEKLSDGTYIYRVEVRSSISPLPVYILYTKDGKNWQRSANRQEYIGAGEWKELIWNREPHYQKLEFVTDLGGR